MDDKLLITDEMLLAWLDGEADKVVIAEIEAMPDLYTDRLEVLRSAENALRSRLRHLPTMTPPAIGEYTLGLGDETTRERQAAYLGLHPHARKEAALLDQFLTELEPDVAREQTPGLLHQVRVFVARLVGDGSAASAMAIGLRGAQEGVYVADQYQIVLESDTDLDDPDRLALSGLLTGQAEDARLSITLWRVADSSALSTVEIDEFGNFTFGRLESGKYELIVSGDATDEPVEIHIQNVEV